MNVPEHASPAASASRSRWQRIGPVVTLLLLSPIVSEVLAGSTRLTTLFVLIPATGVWGCAALLIREASRRWGKAGSLLLLGLALAVAEECIIQQTSLAPLVGSDAAHGYGRSLGVNWVYLVWALGFESIWAVVVPVALTGVLFPDRRNEVWIGRRGAWIAAVVLVLSSFAAWYSWTQVYVPKFFPQSVYHPPLTPRLIALAAIGALIFAAVRVRRSAPVVSPPSFSPLPSGRMVGLAAFALALPWYLLVLLAFNVLPALPVTVPLLGGLVIAVAAMRWPGRWLAQPDFGDAHRLALILGVVAATLVGGIATLAAAKALLIDRIAQIGFNLATIAWLLALARRRSGEAVAAQ